MTTDSQDTSSTKENTTSTSDNKNETQSSKLPPTPPNGSVSTTPSLSISGTCATFYPINKPIVFTPKVSGPSTGTLVFSIVGNPLPKGLSLDVNTGVISGTCTSVEKSTTILMVGDSTQTAMLPLSFNFVELSTINATPTGAVVGVPYVCSLPIVGGLGTRVISDIEGSPDWLTIQSYNNEIVLSGTPKSSGTFSITFSITDDYGTNKNSISLVVDDVLSVVYNKTSLILTPYQTFSMIPSVGGGTGTNTFSFTGNVPGTISINSTTGVVSGNLVSEGNYAFSVQTISGSQTVVTNLAIVVCAPLKLTYSPLTGVVDTSLSLFPTVTGGTGTKTFSLETPSSTSTSTKSTTMVAVPGYSTGSSDSTPASTIPLTKATTGTTTNTSTSSQSTSNDSSTTQPYLLPIPQAPGLYLNTNTGVISGTPSIVVDVQVDITVTDASGSNTTTVSILTIAKLILSGTLPVLGVDTPFSFTPKVSGGNALMYSFNYTCQGQLPSGISFNTKTGELNGSISTTISDFPLTIICTDGLQTANLPLNLNVVPLASLTPIQATSFSVGIAGMYSLQGSNWGSSVTFKIIEGTLPPGLTLNSSTGVISGIPTMLGNYSVSIQMISVVNTVTCKVDILVNNHITVSGTIPQGTIGIPYYFTPTVIGGDKSNYSFNLTTSATGNALIDGLQFSTTTGTIDGTPTQTGYLYVSISCTDGQTTGTLANQPLMIVSLENSTNPQASDMFVLDMLKEHASILSNSTVTPLMRQQAIECLSKATNALLTHPTDTSFEYMFEYQEQYQDTLYLEKNILIGNGVLSPTDRIKVSSVYSAFRHVVTNPSITYDYDYLGSSPFNCPTLAIWLQSKCNSIISAQSKIKALTEKENV